jgi:hypothetical protein
MSKTEQQTAQEEAMISRKQEKTAEHYEDNDPVTVIWKSWGTNGMPSNKVTYFDRQMFEGGVGRRIPYGIAQKWQKQGHGVLIFDVDATEADFIRATGHKPLDDDKLTMLLKATPLDKIAALLGPDAVEKITAMQNKK